MSDNEETTIGPRETWLLEWIMMQQALGFESYAVEGLRMLTEGVNPAHIVLLLAGFVAANDPHIEAGKHRGFTVVCGDEHTPVDPDAAVRDDPSKTAWLWCWRLIFAAAHDDKDQMRALMEPFRDKPLDMAHRLHEMIHISGALMKRLMLGHLKG
jgi:hypothetical protein